MAINDVWQNCLSLCEKRQISVRVLFLPERFRDRFSAKDRAAVVRDLKRMGWSMSEIQQVCPLRKETAAKLAALQEGASGDLPFSEIRLMERPCFGHFQARSLRIYSR